MGVGILFFKQSAWGGLKCFPGLYRAVKFHLLDSFSKNLGRLSEFCPLLTNNCSLFSVSLFFPFGEEIYRAM